MIYAKYAIAAGIFAFGSTAGAFVANRLATARVERCAAGLTAGNPGKCPDNIERSYLAVLNGMKLDVADKQVEARDAIVPIINERVIVDRQRERALESDIEELRNELEQTRACAASKPLATLREQLLHAEAGADIDSPGTD